MTEKNTATFKDRLREAMLYRNMKAVELVEKTGVPKGAISYYLAGKSQPKADRLYIIAQALEVSEAWLLGYDVSMHRTAEQKKNDQLSKLIVKMRTDMDFFSTVAALSELTEKQYDSIKRLISTFNE